MNSVLNKLTVFCDFCGVKIVYVLCVSMQVVLEGDAVVLVPTMDEKDL